uniref:FAD-binding monooxygenase hmp7 n=1 Tax=Hypomyces subiculosus TaxID=193393 RepID=HPM7_HYPSB|nr:RecName: Full=FAD-binding monooxygenase hmp7; Short=FMO hmp7; AltName: Full=Hypothemycin biosynthesis cluster protein hpm7 [Hypomyces subiculosus]ACD39757.1 flavin-dependent monooxygenase [Hypomyces subiculosus]ACD39766.1 flavin-dependent monooxygenase [Hypomyces subiculosus]
MTRAILPDVSPDSIDPQFLEEKYDQERLKRINAAGYAKYSEVGDGELERFKVTHRLEDVASSREPVSVDTDVVIIGAGYAGILTAVRLVQNGILNFRIVEKGNGFGGTWYWNQYPGAQCDVESYIYMPLLEETGYVPTERYARGPEILKHINLIAKKWELAPKTHFQSEVSAADWTADRWTVKTRQGDEFRSRYLVTAIGPFHRPKLPGVPGINSFKGNTFHSSGWDYEASGGSATEKLTKFSDKTIGIIGTGATAVQMLPFVANSAKEVLVFQRTPAPVNVRNNGPTPPDFAKFLEPGWQLRRMDNFNKIYTGEPIDTSIVSEEWLSATLQVLFGTESDKPSDPAELEQLLARTDFQVMERIRRRVDETIKDPVTREQLKPWYATICKRPCFHDEYLECFNRPNVRLVDTDGKGVDRITEDSVVVDGKEHHVDALVFCTGFEYLSGVDRHGGFTVTGKDGVTLTERWTPGPSTYHGLYVHGFPNFFCLQTAQAGTNPNFMYTATTGSTQIGHVIAECLKDGVREVQPTKQAEDDWVKMILEGGRGMMHLMRNCTPGYMNNDGNLDEKTARRMFYPGGPTAWRKLLEAWREKGDFEGLQRTY